MLSLVKDNNAHLVFPNMTELLKIYGTLPVSTATVEYTFLKLKLVKTKLHSLCKEERLSELLLLAIEKDVPINHSDIIDIEATAAPQQVSHSESVQSTLSNLCILSWSHNTCLIN